MKKIVTVSLSVLLLLGLSGCGAPELADKVSDTVKQEEQANTASLENDVRNTVTNVATYIASNPNAKDLSAVKIVKTGDNQITVTVPAGKTIYEYKVVGKNASGDVFTFDGATGQYS